jgi:hypothetical protein
MSLQNQLESGFDLDTEKNAEERYKKGIFAMELLLGIGEDKEDKDCFRNKVKNIWREKALIKYSNVGEKIIFYCIEAIIIFVLMVLPIIVMVNNGGDEPTGAMIVTWLILLAAAFILFFANRSHLQRKYKDKTESDLNEWDLYEDKAFKNTSCLGSWDLESICRKLGINPTEAKVGFGRVKGGGSTWIGTGSGGMVGLGIGLSVLSSIGAASKNSSTNFRAEILENFVFYNNVAAYFNENVSQGANEVLLSQ